MVDDGDALRQVVGLFEVVCRQQDGQPVLARKLRDLAPHVRARLRIKPGCRLVEEENLRLMDQAHRHVELALHATRERACDALVRFGEIEALQQPGDAPPQLATGEAIQLPLQPQVLGRRRLEVHRRLLPDDADQAAHTVWLAHDIAPHDAGASGVGPRKRGQNLDNGGFASAVRPQQREDRARFDTEADALERLHITGIGLDESRSFDGWSRDSGGRAGRSGWLDSHGHTLFLLDKLRLLCYGRRTASCERCCIR